MCLALQIDDPRLVLNVSHAARCTARHGVGSLADSRLIVWTYLPFGPRGSMALLAQAPEDLRTAAG
jgi:hypothetical protein